MDNRHTGNITQNEADSSKKIPTEWGAKIGGARKDYYSEYADRFAKAKNMDIETEPLSKSWPEPDYEKLVEGGKDPWIVAFARAARDEIPTKPQKSWRLSTWVSNVKMLREFADNLLSGKITKDRFLEELSKPEYYTVKRDIGGRAELYERFGHSQSLKGISLSDHHYSIYRGEENVDKWIVERKTKGSIFGNMPSELGVGNTKEEALAAFGEKYSSLAGQEPGKRKTQFVIYKRRDTGKFYVAKKMGASRYLELKQFDSSSEALDYRANHQADLEKQLERIRDIPSERREFNRERVGKDHRQGKDATPETFQNAFGFRGVEFGNWVNSAERQDNLNRAYDALYDLANILGIPTKTISLNGELGLGFGSRGHGGKNAPAAHYEPDRVVINLTRKNGPGSLGHEWFHSLDSYMSRSRGKPLGYMTEQPKPIPGDITRPEVLNAFDGVMKAIDKTGLKARSEELDKTRSEPYWAEKIEMAARAFESYTIDKLKDMGATNDYLANIATSPEYAKALATYILDANTQADAEMYPYLLESELPGVKAAFDNLFSTLKTKETEKGTAIYEPPAPYAAASTEEMQFSHKDAGMTEGEFNKAYDERAMQDVGETRDEFLQRVFCAETLGGENNFTIRK